jgi:gamma-glutamylcyclotransferase
MNAMADTTHTHLYFAYGSNMCADQMRTRCPAAKSIGVGYVRRYELVFNRKGTYRPGAVASMVPSERDQCVYGVIWDMTSEELAIMDAIEQSYERVLLDVFALDGRVHQCQTYIAIPESDPPLPDPEYVAILLHAATEARLPATYIETITKLVHR